MTYNYHAYALERRENRLSARGQNKREHCSQSESQKKTNRSIWSYRKIKDEVMKELAETVAGYACQKDHKAPLNGALKRDSNQAHASQYDGGN
jgi:transposase